MARSTEILASFFHTPGGAAASLFNGVLRAGHLRAASDYRVERDRYPGHDLLLCVSGAGFLRTGDRTFVVSAGQIGWIDCRRPHAHFPAPEDPWELLWLRAEGPQLGRVAGVLQVQRLPTFVLADPDAAVLHFRRILRLLETRPPALEAALHAELAGVLAQLFASRCAEGLGGEDETRALSPGLRKVVERLTVYHQRSWSIDEMARLARMSVPHFFRCFRQATGSSPLNFLRRERINRAKRLLSETSEQVSAIAEQVGYNDPFYFSRDFKKVVGLSPARYRAQENGRPPPER